MLQAINSRLALVTILAGLVLALVFTTLVLKLRSDLSVEVNEKMIARAAGILQPVAQRQFDRQLDASPLQPMSNQLVTALLASARQEGMLAMAIFDADGATLESVPSGQILVELPIEDFVTLGNGGLISRFKRDFSLSQIEPIQEASPRSPVLEVLLPIQRSGFTRPVGYVRYHMDARLLAADLDLIEERMQAQTHVTLTIGLASIAAILAAAFFGLRHAQRTINERNARIVKNEVELSLAARTSAMGQITSHLMHGVQGAVAGLRSAVNSGQAPDWDSVADYTTRLQAMTQEALTVLGDLRSNASYSLTSEELSRIIFDRNKAAANDRQVDLRIDNRLSGDLDNRRGGILCLIADNLIQNALQASPERSFIGVALERKGAEVYLRVSDQGSGIPELVRERLFQPGASTRPGGTGLGLALSRLLARQIDGELSLASTGPSGSSFELRIPV